MLCPTLPSSFHHSAKHLLLVSAFLAALSYLSLVLYSQDEVLHQQEATAF